MPRVNIYIRNGDWEKWQAIKDKPEWIREGLNATSAFEGIRMVIPADVGAKKEPKRKK